MDEEEAVGRGGQAYIIDAAAQRLDIALAEGLSLSGSGVVLTTTGLHNSSVHQPGGLVQGGDDEGVGGTRGLAKSTTSLVYGRRSRLAKRRGMHNRRQ